MTPDQRLDVQIARSQLDMAGKSEADAAKQPGGCGLGVRHGFDFDNASGTANAASGWASVCPASLTEDNAQRRDAMNALHCWLPTASTARCHATSSAAGELFSYQTAYDVAKQALPRRESYAAQTIG
jgi:hypothetical protein